MGLVLLIVGDIQLVVDQLKVEFLYGLFQLVRLLQQMLDSCVQLTLLLLVLLRLLL